MEQESNDMDIILQEDDLYFDVVDLANLLESITEFYFPTSALSKAFDLLTTSEKEVIKTLVKQIIVNTNKIDDIIADKIEYGD